MIGTKKIFRKSAVNLKFHQHFKEQKDSRKYTEIDSQRGLQRKPVKISRIVDPPCGSRNSEGINNLKYKNSSPSLGMHYIGETTLDYVEILGSRDWDSSVE